MTIENPQRGASAGDTVDPVSQLSAPKPEHATEPPAQPQAARVTPTPVAPVAAIGSDRTPADARPDTTPAGRRLRKKRSAMDRMDTFISRLSTRNNFWHRVCSMIWLPYAFKSGIQMKRLDGSTFSAVLPFRRFNRNWYNAMAGAALLANSEVAGGMYVFAECGGEYTVVCKELTYKFLRPCLGPALYKIKPREDLKSLVASGKEFNVTLDLDIVQAIGKSGGKERRVGKCEATFHVTPKTHQQAKGRTIR